MKAVTLKKKIIIPYNGYIPLKGVNGPIVVPYMETFENISKLLLSRMPVKEVLTDGTTVDLNLVNYDKENSWNASSTEKKYEPVTHRHGKMVSPKKSKVIVVTDEDAKAETMDALLSRGIDKVDKNKPAEKVNVTNKVTETYESGNAGSYKSKHNKKKHKSHTDEIIDFK
jgi:hypothetical protein